MKKTLAALALAGSIALVGTAPAMAANYPPLPPNAAVSDGVVGPGETFVFRGQGFLAGETLTIRVTPGNPPAASGANIAGSRAVAARISVVTEAQTLKATADANGAFEVPVAINEPGTYLLTATGDTSGITVGPVTVTVAASLANTGGAPLANTGGTPLANTGTDASLLLWGAAGVGALGLGAAGVIVARRNKNEASA
ncbi:LPXTG cell wall anchor domain-containing protein [Pseudarthrobacter oxydans]|uniref:LPXTG cell wall anchor domain-containing protein n=1 Tax=Pseudarthrobacter oxydans TaxID=1671 RepID=UPI003ED0292C